jgi:ketosteroid isomerase-like protein
MNRLLLLPALLLATAALAQAQQVPVTTTSDAARVQYVRGVHSAAHVDFDRARTHLDAALTADPSFAMAHVYRAFLSPPAAREEHMRQAGAASVSEGERQFIEAYAANQRGDHDREGALHEALAARFPNDPMPMFWWATTQLNRGNHAEAVAAANRALAADPAFAPAYNLIGYAEMVAGNTAAAEQAFRGQIRLAPDEANPYDSYGEFLMLEGRLDEAEAQFEMAVTKDPTFEVSRTNLARVGIERSNRRFEQAVASRDVAAVASLYTAGAIVFPPDMGPVRGREAIGELFAGYVANGVDGVDLETLEVQAMGNFAHELGTGTLRVGGEVVDRFSYSVLWARVGDEWRLHRDIWNSDGPPATGARH